MVFDVVPTRREVRTTESFMSGLHTKELIQSSSLHRNTTIITTTKASRPAILCIYWLIPVPINTTTEASRPAILCI